MDKLNVVDIYSGILFRLQKEGESDICYNMDDLRDMMLSETSQS